MGIQCILCVREHGRTIENQHMVPICSTKCPIQADIITHTYIPPIFEKKNKNKIKKSVTNDDLRRIAEWHRPCTCPRYCPTLVSTPMISSWDPWRMLAFFLFEPRWHWEWLAFESVLNMTLLVVLTQRDQFNTHSSTLSNGMGSIFVLDCESRAWNLFDSEYLFGLILKNVTSSSPSFSLFPPYIRFARFSPSRFEWNLGRPILDFY